ncbi:14259_t:CDS:2 [Rhizophagus irregularis]|nr:14259_t:CDS:2 [Rhizophagus irregularis]
MIFSIDLETGIKPNQTWFHKNKPISSSWPHDPYDHWKEIENFAKLNFMRFEERTCDCIYF